MKRPMGFTFHQGHALGGRCQRWHYARAAGDIFLCSDIQLSWGPCWFVQAVCAKHEEAVAPALRDIAKLKADMKLLDAA